MQQPERVLGLVFGRGGTGANRYTRDKFIADALAMADQVQDFLARVEAGQWPRRDPRSQTVSKV